MLIFTNFFKDSMNNPVRITVSLDEEVLNIFKKLKEELALSQSEIFRRALRFYYDHKELEYYNFDRLRMYADMLAEGEHVILDIDHWIAFLDFIETHPSKNDFWKIHEEVAEAHAEEFNGKDVDYILKRLEACNFFRLQAKDGEYVLILSHERTKKFVKEFLAVIFKKLGLGNEIKEERMKLRVKI